MRKAIILGIAGVFVSSVAMAEGLCGGAHKTAQGVDRFVSSDQKLSPVPAQSTAPVQTTVESQPAASKSGTKG